MKYFLFVFFLSSSIAGFGQSDSSLQVVFYNVENLFDTIDDPNIKDEEYLPEAEKQWNTEKMETKVQNVAKTVVAAAGWERPDIVGLCELENRSVLEMIADNSAFDGLEMEVVHFESPDRRGIDVGLLYSSTNLELLHSEAIRLSFDFDTNLRSRDILYAKFKSSAGSEFHVFVNHWPSRWGGKEASEPKRLTAAHALRTKIDSIKGSLPSPNIIIMGDMNDHPEDNSITQILNAKTDTSEYTSADLLALMGLELNFEGSHRYRGEWAFLDQFIISGTLLQEPSPKATSFGVYHDDHLLEEDKRYPGVMPFRTYSGPYYKGGYSDHLPVYLNVRLK